MQSEHADGLVCALGDPDLALPQNVIAKESPRVVEGMLLVLAHIAVTHPIGLVPSSDDLLKVGLREISNFRHAGDSGLMEQLVDQPIGDLIPGELARNMLGRPHAERAHVGRIARR